MVERQAESQSVQIPKDRAQEFAKYDQFLMQRFYFLPVDDSRGRHYVISISASGGAAGNSVSVYGSRTDAYRDGETRRNGELLPGDFAFRYGCHLR